MTSRATLGGGCFWCLEAAYQLVEGITGVVSGYAGGQWPNPTYERVATGTTGHAEVVQVQFAPGIITYAQVLDIFWALHNPTTPNQQGHDVGPQYRSIILYEAPEERLAAEASRNAAAALWPNPIVTEIVPLETFWPAEDYHQDYYQKHPEQGYCQIVINPKLKHLRATFAARLKKA